MHKNILLEKGINFFKHNFKIILVFIFFVIIYLYKLGSIPYGFFCDEALTGLRAWELINGNFSNFEGPFFYHHFNYIFGSLSVYATAPFVFIFGLNEFSVRLTSVFFAFLSLVILFLIFKKIKSTNILFTIILFMVSPIFFHLSRVNFSHLPSLFFLITGYYFYINSLIKNNYLNSIMSGIFFGISLYGYPGFVIGTGAIIFSILLTELVYNKIDLSKYKKIILLIISFFVLSIPIIYSVLFSPNFLLRLKEKGLNINRVNYKDSVIELISNYPKYYSYKYLFLNGEESAIYRHSIKGNGLFLTTSFFLLVISFIFLLVKNKNKRYYLPFFILFFIYPIPDIITTNNGDQPYTISIFATIIFFPFLINYALDSLIKVKFFNHKLFISAIYAVVCIESIIFFNNYLQYPIYSSDYWGWQSGPKEIISYFKSQTKNYDELYMTGSFNAPEIFLKFYDPESKCNNCFIGGIYQLDSNKKQLFAFRITEINDIKKIMLNKKFKIKKTIYLPNNSPEFVIGSFVN